MSAIAGEVAHRERLNREVEIAREVQERLFPQTLPPIVGIEYSGACRPALGVGGDYYDFLALPGGYLGIAIGDVSGKGNCCCVDDGKSAGVIAWRGDAGAEESGSACRQHQPTVLLHLLTNK